MKLISYSAFRLCDDVIIVFVSQELSQLRVDEIFHVHLSQSVFYTLWDHMTLWWKYETTFLEEKMRWLNFIWWVLVVTSYEEMLKICTSKENFTHSHTHAFSQREIQLYVYLFCWGESARARAYELSLSAHPTYRHPIYREHHYLPIRKTESGKMRTNEWASDLEIEWSVVVARYKNERGWKERELLMDSKHMSCNLFDETTTFEQCYIDEREREGHKDTSTQLIYVVSLAVFGEINGWLEFPEDSTLHSHIYILRINANK